MEKESFEKFNHGIFKSLFQFLSMDAFIGLEIIQLPTENFVDPLWFSLKKFLHLFILLLKVSFVLAS